MPATRNTVQRQLILEAVNALHNHPTAEDIYVHVADTHPSISRATVYRNLSGLAQQGLVQRVSHLDAADRFDFELKPHYHFRCTNCDSVYDVDMPYQADILCNIPNPQGFQFTGHEITFTGLCSKCQKSRSE